MTSLSQKWQATKLLTRMDKPIGTYLRFMVAGIFLPGTRGYIIQQEM